MLTHYGSVPASGTRIIVSPAIPSRFIITAVRGEALLSFGAAVTDVGARLKVSSENSNGGGLNTPGYDVQLGETANGVWPLQGEEKYVFPQHFVDRLGWFVKIIAINIGIGGPQFYMINVSIQLLE